MPFVSLRLVTGLLTEQVGRGTVGQGRSRNPSRFLAKGQAWKERAEGGIGARGQMEISLLGEGKRRPGA